MQQQISGLVDDDVTDDAADHRAPHAHPDAMAGGGYTVAPPGGGHGGPREGFGGGGFDSATGAGASADPWNPAHGADAPRAANGEYAAVPSKFGGVHGDYGRPNTGFGTAFSSYGRGDTGFGSAMPEYGALGRGEGTPFGAAEGHGRLGGWPTRPHGGFGGVPADVTHTAHFDPTHPRAQEGHPQQHHAPLHEGSNAYTVGRTLGAQPPYAERGVPRSVAPFDVAPVSRGNSSGGGEYSYDGGAYSTRGHDAAHQQREVLQQRETQQREAAQREQQERERQQQLFQQQQEERARLLQHQQQQQQRQLQHQQQQQQQQPLHQHQLEQEQQPRSYTSATARGTSVMGGGSGVTSPMPTPTTTSAPPVVVVPEPVDVDPGAITPLASPPVPQPQPIYLEAITTRPRDYPSSLADPKTPFWLYKRGVDEASGQVCGLCDGVNSVFRVRAQGQCGPFGCVLPSMCANQVGSVPQSLCPPSQFRLLWQFLVSQ